MLASLLLLLLVFLFVLLLIVFSFVRVTNSWVECVIRVRRSRCVFIVSIRCIIICVRSYELFCLWVLFIVMVCCIRCLCYVHYNVCLLLCVVFLFLVFAWHPYYYDCHYVVYCVFLFWRLLLCIRFVLFLLLLLVYLLYLCVVLLWCFLILCFRLVFLNMFVCCYYVCFMISIVIIIIRLSCCYPS